MLLVVENNSPFVRGNTRALMEIEQRVLAPYSMCKLDPKGCEYELTIPYENDQDLDHIVAEILREAAEIADRRNGFIEVDVTAQDGSERHW